MEQLDRLVEGIKRADAAGDTAGVAALGAEYRRLQSANAPSAADAPSKAAPSWLDTAAKVASNAGREIADTAKAAANFVESLPNDPLGYKIARAIKAAPGTALDYAGGALQYARNLSPENARGDWPTLPGGEAENHPYLALANLNTAPMQKYAVEHPLALVGDVASAAGMTSAGRAVLGKIADATTYIPRKTVQTIADMTPSRRASNALLSAAASTKTDPSVLAALLERNKSTVPGVDYSAAQATQNPGITQIEKGSRMNPALGPAWAQFDTGQNTGLFNALQNVVDPATDEAVALAKSARNKETQYSRQAALALADQGSLEAGTSRDASGTFAGPIRAKVNQLMAGEAAANPAARRLANFVLGPNNIPSEGATAGRAYETRKILTDSLNKKVGINPSAIEAAAKSAGVTTGAIKGAIDESLNKASGGMWQQYLDEFKASSKDVNSIQALNDIRSDLAKKIEGGAIDSNGNPKITRAYLKQVIEKNSTNKYGDLILPGPKSDLNNILNTAQQIEAPQANYRLAATGGVGSDTVANAALVGGSHLMGGLGPIARAGLSLLPTGEVGGTARLAALLQSPTDAASALRAAAARAAARKAGSSGVNPAAIAALLSQYNQGNQ